LEKLEQVIFLDDLTIPHLVPAVGTEVIGNKRENELNEVREKQNVYQVFSPLFVF